MAAMAQLKLLLDGERRFSPHGRDAIRRRRRGARVELSIPRGFHGGSKMK